jgi:hypothetical protein
MARSTQMLLGGVAQGLLKFMGKKTLPGKGTEILVKNTAFSL